MFTRRFSLVPVISVTIVGILFTLQAPVAASAAGEMTSEKTATIKKLAPPGRLTLRKVKRPNFVARTSVRVSKSDKTVIKTVLRGRRGTVGRVLVLPELSYYGASGVYAAERVTRRCKNRKNGRVVCVVKNKLFGADYAAGVVRASSTISKGRRSWIRTAQVGTSSFSGVAPGEFAPIEVVPRSPVLDIPASSPGPVVDWSEVELPVVSPTFDVIVSGNSSYAQAIPEADRVVSPLVFPFVFDASLLNLDYAELNTAVVSVLGRWYESVPAEVLTAVCVPWNFGALLDELDGSERITRAMAWRTIWQVCASAVPTISELADPSRVVSATKSTSTDICRFSGLQDKDVLSLQRLRTSLAGESPSVAGQNWVAGRVWRTVDIADIAALRWIVADNPDYLAGATAGTLAMFDEALNGLRATCDRKL